MSPSSPVSVGTLPSNSTLDLGLLQLDRELPVPVSVIVTSEQCPVAEDPFTDTSSEVGME